MNNFITLWKEYIESCESKWKIETERTRLINEHKRINSEPGFVFPTRNKDNTPSFEGYMGWLIENNKEITS